jgi:hypothetical protein
MDSLKLRKFLAPEIIFSLGALQLAGQYGRNLGGSKADHQQSGGSRHLTDRRVGDIAVIKSTPLKEHLKLIFRWEVFNVLNRPNFSNPANDVSTPSTFGVISALSVNPRIMQYTLPIPR